MEHRIPLAAIDPLLQVRITAQYGKSAPVLRDASFDVRPGEVVGLLGQSGSGKTTVALTLLGLIGMRGGAAHGGVVFQGTELLSLSGRALREIRGRRIGFVSQSPATALNPAMRLEAHLTEAWRAHATGKPPYRELMESVSLPGDEAFLRRYPGQLSVGQGQRFVIALAILHSPDLLIADEPTSALDVITQAGILNLFAGLNQKLGMAILYISHDLLSVARLCTRVAILHEGQVVESGPTEQVFQRPQHAYTRAMVAAIPAALPHLAR